MTVTRVRATLEQPEYSALLRIARAELRNPDDQIRYILRQELQRRGLLQPSDVKQQKQNQEDYRDP
jgi:hypothetical protein